MSGNHALRPFLYALVLGSSSAYGFVAPTAGHFVSDIGPIVVRPDLIESGLANANGMGLDGATDVQVDKHSGAVRLITGNLVFDANSGLTPSSGPGDYVREARRYILHHRDIFGVKRSDLILVPDAVLIDEDVQFVSFHVSRHGVLVEDAGIDVRFKQGVLVQIVNRTFSEAPNDTRPLLNGAQLTTLDQVPLANPTFRDYVLRVRATTDGYELVRVARISGLLEGEPVDSEVEAATGKTYQMASQRHYLATGKASAMTFSRTWFQSQPEMAPLSELLLKVGSASVYTGTDGLFEATDSAKLTGFQGKRTTVRPTTGTTVSQSSVKDGETWVLDISKTAEKDIAQANTYRHLNAVVAKAKQYISIPWMDRSLQANVNLSQTCNAYWDGTAVNFFSTGGGCANTSLVADVMYHEWGHGLDANTGGIDDSAYSEGFGDIISMLMTRDSIMAPGFKSNGAGIRDLEPDKVYPRDQGEMHAEGLIIAGAFWDLYKALAAKSDADSANDLVSKYAFKTISTARLYTDVYQAVLVVDDDDSNPSNKTPNYCEINTAFSAHGLAVKDSSCK